MFVAAFVGALAVCAVAEVVATPIPVVESLGNLVFALLLMAALAGEAVVWRRPETTMDGRWGVAAVGALGLAFAIWNLAKEGRPWCDPATPFQGHAAWHLLCAVSAYCLFRLYASERPAPG